MDIYTATRIEGTANYQILCYVLCRIENLGPLEAECQILFSGNSNIKLTQLYYEEWPCGILLVESTRIGQEGFPADATEIMCQVSQLKFFLGLSCMYDGVFDGYDSIMSPELADQIYGFSLKSGEINLVMDEFTRGGDEWRQIISRARTLLDRGHAVPEADQESGTESGTGSGEWNGVRPR